MDDKPNVEKFDIECPENDPVVFSGGNVIPVNAKQVTAQTLLTRIKQIFNAPYKGTNKARQGLSMSDAAILALSEAAAEGDQPAFEKLTNRIMGKPLQQVANLNVSGTLEDFLTALAHEDGYVPKQEIDPLGD